jgi:hypothetical protein
VPETGNELRVLFHDGADADEWTVLARGYFWRDRQGSPRPNAARRALRL